LNDHPARLSTGEAALLVLGGFVAGSGAVVWLGAALAALVAGGRLSGGLSDAVRAAFRLPQHVGDPRAAWPSEPDRAALPGPLVYWLCTVVVVVCLAAVFMVLLRLWRLTRDRGRVRLGVETRARFASRHDLAPLVVDQPVPT